MIASFFTICMLTDQYIEYTKDMLDSENLSRSAEGRIRYMSTLAGTGWQLVYSLAGTLHRSIGCRTYAAIHTRHAIRCVACT